MPSKDDVHKAHTPSSREGMMLLYLKLGFCNDEHRPALSSSGVSSPIVVKVKPCGALDAILVQPAPVLRSLVVQSR